MRAAGPSDPEGVAAGIFRKEVTITSRHEIFSVSRISLKYTRGGGGEHSFWCKWYFKAWKWITYNLNQFLGINTDAIILVHSSR